MTYNVFGGTLNPTLLLLLLLYRFECCVSCALLHCVVDDASAFSYLSLHPHGTEVVRIISVEDDGQLVCRPVYALRDATRLQQQLQNIYSAGI